MTNKTVKINLETYLNIRRLIPALPNVEIADEKKEVTV